MGDAAYLDVTCEDFLRDNPHLYAHKARRKRIGLISIEAVNRDAAEIRIDLATASLVVAGHAYGVEPPGLIIRKFSEFTWDFVVYSILDFHPVLVAVDAFFFLTGPLYNRRLKKQLHLLSDSEMILGPGSSKKAILGFRRVSKGTAQLQFSYRRANGERQQMTCDIPQAGR